MGTAMLPRTWRATRLRVLWAGHGESLLTDRIIGPLGLKQSALSAEELIQHPIALGYQRTGGTGELKRTSVWSFTRGMGPAGGLMCCSASDLIRLGTYADE